MARLLRLPCGSSQAFCGHLWRCTVPSFRPFAYGLGASRPTTERADVNLPARAWALATQEAREEGDEQAWLDFEDRALERCGHWRGPEMVQVLHACAVAQRRPKRLLAKLAKDIPDKLPQFDASALCVCLHTFAQLRSRDASLFSVVTRRLLHPDRKEELSPSHVSSLLYSHARILQFDKELVRLAKKSLADERFAFEMEDMATVLQAFATLRAEDLRLSGRSARRVAEAAPAAPLPLLADLLEESEKVPGKCKSATVQVVSLVAGTLTGFLVIFRDVSFALVYCAPHALRHQQAVVTASLLLSSAVAQCVYSWRHSFPTVVACASSLAVPFQSAMAASIASKLGNESESVLATVLCSFSLTALAYGLLIFLLSFVPILDHLKGAFPQPVMCAFFLVAGIGMLQGALELVSGQPLFGSHDLEATAYAQMALTVLVGAANRAGSKWLRHFAVLPASLCLQILGFFLALGLLGQNLSAAREEGWLWEPMAPVTLAGLPLPSEVQWPVVGSQLSSMLSLVVMLVVDLTTTLLPLELMTPTKSLQMDEEFRTAGCSSLAGGVFGGVSYVSLSPTRLNVDAGGEGRETGLISAGLCVLWIWLGPELTAGVPKFVVGGMLCHLAFGYILDGLWEPRALLSHGDYAIILAMVLYYLATDLVPAILVGLALCSFNFMLRYSQSGPLEFVTTAGEAAMFSNRFRSTEDRLYLKTSRGIVVARTFCSQLFFGSIAAILSEVGPWLKDGRFLLLDLSSLRSIDSSALAGFRKLPPHVQTVAVGLPLQLDTQVRRAGLPVCIFQSIDEALEWCEDHVLKFRYLEKNSTDLNSYLLGRPSNNPSLPAPDEPRIDGAAVSAAVARALGSGLEDLEDLLEQVPVRAREVVFREGLAAEGLYVVVSGALQIQHGSQRGIVLGPGEIAVDVNIKRIFGQQAEARRGKPVSAGDLLCEAALYGPLLHTSSLIADTPSLLLLLRRDKLLLAEKRYPQAAIALHRRLLVSQMQKTGAWPAVAPEVLSSRRTASL
ncbi:unnamed protein product [Symbiodinium natans]|uniref:Cyclic nucleotide-binding domain-containing protein n=1 Tax=Symbiodinium natans TaxID=878477 RepID=A0A812ICK8_9DINO|nr:unnamed protein product [Symbiodinium natans]